MMKIFIALLAIIPLVCPSSTGAPSLACVDLVPRHGQPPTALPNPVTIFLSTLGVAPGGQVSIQIVSTSPFRGFLIQPRVVGTTNNSPGTFQTSTTSQSINCHGGILNSATHVINDPRSSQTVVWNAPTNFSGQIRFQ